MADLLTRITTHENTDPEKNFQLDEQLASSCFKLIDWPLTKVLLKNNAHFPWFILVPKRHGLVEITELTVEDRYQLMDEISAISTIIQTKFQPDKINTAAIGNVVSQCHIHVVARFTTDPLWPQSIWQSSQPETPYLEPQALIDDLQTQLLTCFGT